MSSMELWWFKLYPIRSQPTFSNLSRVRRSQKANQNLFRILLIASQKFVLLFYCIPHHLTTHLQTLTQRKTHQHQVLYLGVLRHSAARQCHPHELEVLRLYLHTPQSMLSIVMVLYNHHQCHLVHSRMMHLNLWQTEMLHLKLLPNQL